MIIEDVLRKLNLKYEDLNSAEKETLHTWMEALNQNKLTLERVKSYIAAMRDQVEQELTKTNHNCKQDIFLKARLRNYLLLEAFLSTPEKAKEAIDRVIAGIASKKTNAI